MKKAIKDAWLSGLRSGDYQQTIHQLHNGKEKIESATAFCCIGVLGVIKGMTGYLDTNDVVVAQGLRAYSNTLIKMNDEEGRSFPEIADWIEANISTED